VDIRLDHEMDLIENYPEDNPQEADLELYNLDAERDLLGSILVDPGVLGDVSLFLDDFHDRRHQLIWRAIDEVSKNGGVSILTVAEQLRKEKQYDDIGGMSYLTQLSTSTSFNTTGAERIIRDYSIRRQSLELTQTFARSIIHNSANLADLDWMVLRLGKLREKINPNGVVNSSTWSDLDGVIGPILWEWPDWLARGFLNILVGMTGEGKSILALRICACYLLGWAWPDGSKFEGQPGNIIWCEAEAAQALNLARAKKWGLPIDRILNPLGDPLSDFRLNNQEHKDKLAFMAMRPDVGFIVVDSLSGADPTAEKSTEDTCNVNWLAALARDTQKPIQLTHHLRKRNIFDKEGEVSLDRVRGISTILQYSRLIWALDTPDLTHKDNKRLAVIKSNLSKKPDPIGVTIDDHGVTFGDAPQAPHIETVTDKASDILMSLLRKEPVQAEKIQVEIEGAGISWISAKRAKKSLGIVSVKKADGKWYWSLPAGDEGIAYEWTNH
jgi:hypothetical protein